MWPWSQSWSESYLVNEVVISVVSFSDLYKTHVWWFFSPAVSEGHMMLPAVVKLCCGISYPHVRSMTGKRMTSHHVKSVHVRVWFLMRVVLSSAGLRRAAVAALGQELSHLRSEGHFTCPVWSSMRRSWSHKFNSQFVFSFHLLELNISSHIILLNLIGFTDIYFILILIYIKILLIVLT